MSPSAPAPSGAPSGPPPRWFWVGTGLAALAGAVVRVWWVLGSTRNQGLQGDQVYYHVQGQALAEGAGFVNPYAWADTASRVEIPSALHPPLYSLYLGLLSLGGASSELAHRLGTGALGVATIVAVAFAARRIAGDRAGVIAAVAAAFYPNLWINDGVLAAESLYALTIALVIWASYRYWQQPGLLPAALLGGTVALATLTRAEALVLFGLLVLPLTVLGREQSWSDRLRFLTVAGGVGVALLAPWVVRNLVQFDEPVILSTGAGYVLEISNCDESWSGEYVGYWNIECDRDHTWVVQPELEPGMTPEEEADARFEAGIANARLEAANERSKRQEGLSYVRENQRRLPVVVAARVGRMWELYAPAQGVDLNTFFERRGRAPSQAALASYYVLAALGVVGLVALWRRRVTIVPFVALAVMVTFAAAVSFGITRYRVGADVGLAVLAGVAIDALVRWRRAPRSADV